LKRPGAGNPFRLTPFQKPNPLQIFVFQLTLYNACEKEDCGLVRFLGDTDDVSHATLKTIRLKSKNKTVSYL
jgi:hypothetical protein